VKKILVILLAFSYLAITSGVVVSVHYCMGEVAGVAVGHSNADTCGSCGMDNKGCCHDDVNVVKIQDSHSMASIQADFPKAETIAQQFSLVFSVPALVSGMRTIESAHSPPRASQIPLHVLHSVFRI
jgi:hypothetical protein